MEITTVFILLAIFQVKHFLADYPLQTGYMLGKFKPSPDYIGPLHAHASVHAALTFIIVLVFSSWPLAILTAIFDHTVHFLVDRLKASPKLLGRHKSLTAKDYPTATEKQRRGNKYFWWSLGFDQMAHHFTHYAIIYFILVM